ncbi:MAG TPA: adenylate/guanylate cyclase domain-containing protein [Acidobacteriota bacterium]|jgi:class 3 adenylate cyclase
MATALNGNTREFRLFLEDLCCDLCRFSHVAYDGCSPEGVRIDREIYLGVRDVFADIRVSAPGRAPYFVEVNFGYGDDEILRSLRRKFGTEAPLLAEASKIIVLFDQAGRQDRQKFEDEMAERLRPGLMLEVWDENILFSLLSKQFGVRVDSITEDRLLELRTAVDVAKATYAFGGDPDDYFKDPIRAALLWHFSFWRLRELIEWNRAAPRDILQPSVYRRVVVLMADLCSFSSYVRDTREDEIIRQSLTAFYSKARHQIINNGGMMYQFAGDLVIGFFGIPDHKRNYVQQALETAKSLIDIGNSVSNQWQRRIDRIQTSGGVHISLAMGDLQIVSLRPLSRIHMGAVGDAINMGSRLMHVADSCEIVASNAFYQELGDATKESFTEMKALEARNIGRIRAWKLTVHHGYHDHGTASEEA